MSETNVILRSYARLLPGLVWFLDRLPGLARPLTIIDDYETFKYNKAKIVLKEKFLGKKTYKGFLKGIDKNGKILLETENHKIKFNFLEIEKANIDPNWAIENN